MNLKKATPAVLGYIAATWAGQRTQSQEQERRKKERKRDKRCCLEANQIEWNEEEKGENGQDDREQGG